MLHIKFTVWEARVKASLFELLWPPARMVATWAVLVQPRHRKYSQCIVFSLKCEPVRFYSALFYVERLFVWCMFARERRVFSFPLCNACGADLWVVKSWLRCRWRYGFVANVNAFFTRCFAVVPPLLLTVDICLIYFTNVCSQIFVADFFQLCLQLVNAVAVQTGPVRGAVLLVFPIRVKILKPGCRVAEKRNPFFSFEINAILSDKNSISLWSYYCWSLRNLKANY